MKNYIIKLEDDIKAYVLDELEYNHQKYIFAIQLDENGDPIEENTHVLQVYVESDKLIAKKIDNFEVASIVSNMFIARLQLENK